MIQTQSRSYWTETSGLGTFLDCASLRIFHYKPRSTEKRDRALEWQAAHDKCTSWQREFDQATARLGKAILAAYTPQDKNEAQMLEVIRAATNYADLSKQRMRNQLSESGIQNLEWNLRFCRE